MDKQIILSKLAQHKHELKKYGLARVGLFGSYVRNMQTTKSDIDVILEFIEGEKTYKNFMLSTDKIEAILNQKIDVVTKEALSPFIGAQILSEAEYVQIA